MRNFSGGGLTAQAQFEFTPLAGLVRLGEWAGYQGMHYAHEYQQSLLTGAAIVGASTATYYSLKWLYDHYYPPRVFSRARKLVYTVTTNPLVMANRDSTFLIAVNQLPVLTKSTRNGYDLAQTNLTQVQKNLEHAHALATYAAAHGNDELVFACKQLTQLITLLQHKIRQRIALLAHEAAWLKIKKP